MEGLQFGRLKVIREAMKPPGYREAHWLCECICGKQIIVIGHCLRNGHTKSCGCFQRETMKQSRLTHGATINKGKLYWAWQSIKARCNNTNNKKWADYGGRGIKVCSRWSKFETFRDDMGNPPTPEHTVERINNDGNYEPSNCRWATRKEQLRNTRRNHMITHLGKTQCLSDWAEELNLSRCTLLKRVRSGKALV